jgi:Fic-DOC domain mobile mystery protein B
MKTPGGNTPLRPEELAGLIPSLATQQELNEWERENILLGRDWALKDHTSPARMASDEYVRKLHARMFDQTWKWAGQYRKTERNLGDPVAQIRERLALLWGDVRHWLERSTYPPDEIAVRFHYRLVVIHPFPNGNGRHARLLADVLAKKLGRPEFTWGATDLIRPGAARAAYLHAMQAADRGDFHPLLVFSRF